MFLINDDHLDKTAIICNDGNIITYKELKKLIENFGNNFEKRSLIFLLVPNKLYSIVSYLACLEYNLIPLLLNERIHNDQLINLIEIYKPKYILSERKIIHYDYLKDVSLEESNLFIRSKTYKTNLHKNLALLLTTSGSTGSPKLVKLTKENIVSNAKSISKYLKLGCDDRAITSLPFYYSYGLSVINSHLFSGGSIVLSKSAMMEEKFWNKINGCFVTSIAGVPYNYDMLLRLGIDNLKIPTVKKMTQAGGKLGWEKVKKINDSLKLKGIDFYVMYGQTEATARISYLPCESVDKKPKSIGIPIPGGKLWIENKKGLKISETMIIGEMVYEGPNVSMGHAESVESLSVGDVNNGVLRTGDLAYFDEEGYFFIEGRNNRFIKVFGNRISLNSLEKLIAKKGFDNIVIGEDDKIIIYIKKTKRVSIGNFIKEISEEIGINMVAITIKQVDDFPRLDSGKINYKVLNT